VRLKSWYVCAQQSRAINAATQGKTFYGCSSDILRNEIDRGTFFWNDDELASRKGECPDFNQPCLQPTMTGGANQSVQIGRTTFRIAPLYDSGSEKMEAGLVRKVSAAVRMATDEFLGTGLWFGFVIALGVGLFFLVGLICAIFVSEVYAIQDL
jgi:hypothetical protein